LYFCVFVGLLLYREGDLVKGFSSLEQGGGSFEGVCFFRGGGWGRGVLGRGALFIKYSQNILLLIFIIKNLTIFKK